MERTRAMRRHGDAPKRPALGFVVGLPLGAALWGVLALGVRALWER